VTNGLSTVRTDSSIVRGLGGRALLASPDSNAAAFDNVASPDYLADEVHESDPSQGNSGAVLLEERAHSEDDRQAYGDSDALEDEKDDDGKAQGEQHGDEQDKGQMEADNHATGREGLILENAEQSTAVVLILLFLITCTIVFDKMKDLIIKHSEGVLQPVSSMLFEELSVLGFLALITFFLQQEQVFKVIGKDSLVTGKDYSHELEHLFEIVHMMLFLVMVMYLAQVLALIFMGRMAVAKWSLGHSAYKNQEQFMEELHALECKTGITAFERMRRSKLRYIREYITMKMQFISPNTFGNVVSAPSRFNLQDYLSRRLGKTIAKVVELPPHTWLLLFMSALFSYAIDVATYSISEDSMLWFAWLVFDYILLACTMVMYEKLAQIQLALLPRLSKVDSVLGEPTHVENYGSISMKVENDGRLKVGHYHFDPPPYQKLMMDKSHWFGVPSLHQSLFEFAGKHGPEVYLQMIRMLLMFMGLHFSLFLCVFAPVLWRHYPPSSFAVIGMLYMIPTVLIYVLYLPGILRMYTVCTSIEMMKDPVTMRETIASSRTKQAAGIMKMMQQIQGASLKQVNSTSSLALDQTKISMLTEYEDMVFAQFDKENLGTINANELNHLLEVLGREGTSVVPTVELDLNENDQITKAELAAWIQRANLRAMDHRALAERFFQLGAEQETVMHLEPRFQHIFRDENGKIVHMTVQLFAKVMTDLGSHLDSDEVDDMISIMQKDGEKAKIISVDSFAMFLQNHHPNH